ncbi:tail fiber domain-containing protein [Flavobacterium tructae]|uniref:tail fiber domain-containing protein n=1 Tax=Flavobacterium tructae TaxID=1114873 RepID=UPI0035A87EA5
MKKKYGVLGIILFSITNQLQAQSTDALKILPNGNIGIGTSTPTQARLVVNGFQEYDFGKVFIYGENYSTYKSGTMKNSIYASDGIISQQFNVASDERIKKIIGISNNENDLKVLSKIEITNYKMIDSVGKGNQTYKKVIAQQIEKVYPIAVKNNLTDFIPNIYQLSSLDKGWIKINSKDLVSGEKIKLIFKEEEISARVLEVNEGTIKVDCAREGTVFVYGKEVSDFHTVDYESIAMLNVSATQAILKRIEILEAEKSTLTKTVSELKKEQQKTDDRLRALERQLMPELAENK